MDLVITVCDSAAAEACPIWPGHPATAHWGYADPSAGDGPDEQKRWAFEQTLQHMQRQLAVFVQLPDEMLQPAKIQAAARAWARGE
jgi:protein-tyrosine-phosphatase